MFADQDDPRQLSVALGEESPEVGVSRYENIRPLEPGRVFQHRQRTQVQSRQHARLRDRKCVEAQVTVEVGSRLTRNLTLADVLVAHVPVPPLLRSGAPRRCLRLPGREGQSESRRRSFPSAIMATTVATGIRRPRMRGWPPILSASTVMRGNGHGDTDTLSRQTRPHAELSISDRARWAVRRPRDPPRVIPRALSRREIRARGEQTTRQFPAHLSFRHTFEGYRWSRDRRSHRRNLGAGRPSGSGSRSSF